MEATISIQGKQYTGIVEDMRLIVEGAILMGNYKLGRYGSKLRQLPVRIMQRSNGTYYAPSYYSANNGQLKDSNMYLIKVIS